MDRTLRQHGYFGAWRILDAQRFGVPQQRRRYFGLFARGRAGAERCAEILAVAQSLRRHPAEGGEAGPRVAFSLTASVGRTSEGSLTASGKAAGSATQQDAENGLLVYGGNDTTGARTVAAGLNAKGGAGRMDFESENLVVAFHPTQDPINGETCHALGAGHQATAAVCVTGDRTHSLRSEGGDASEDGTGRGTPIIAFAQNQRNEVRELTAAGALSAEPGMKQQTYLHAAGTVRRLTPRECTRLMSWPDDYLDLEHFDDGEANYARAFLQHLWRQVGAEEVRRATGGVAHFLSPEVLLSGLHGGWISRAVLADCAAARGAASGENAWPESAVRKVREYAQSGPSPHRREPIEQLARELGRPMPFMSHEGPSFGSAVFYRRLWEAVQGSRFLRHALSALEEMGRPFGGEGDSVRIKDGPRYRMIGNGVVANVAEWIGRRLLHHQPRERDA